MFSTLLARFALVFAVGAGMVFGQVSDTTPPKLVSFSFSPATVDVTAGPQSVSVTLRITDDLSGVSYALVYFNSPTNGQYQSVSPARTSGTNLDGTYTGTVTIPQYSESGNWQVSSIFLRDNASNYASLSTALLNSSGFPTVLGVKSIPDTTPPSLVSLALSTSTINVSSGPQTFTVNLGITDNVSGVSYNCAPGCFWAVWVTSPSGNQWQADPNWDVNQLSGVPTSGVWQAHIILPQFAEAGIWQIGFVELRDAAGNQSILRTTDLAKLGLPTTFTVVSSPSDTVPPNLLTLSYPGTVDTSAADQNVLLTFSASDNLSGLGVKGSSQPYVYWDFGFQSPSGGQSQYAVVYSLVNLSGTPTNGQWTVQLHMPHYSEEGTWTLIYAQLEDAAGNYHYYNTSDLQALGVQTTMNVIQGSQTVDGTLGAGTGGTVNDTVFGSRASITVPPGLIGQNTNVTIDVLQVPLTIPTPQGYSGPGSAFMNLTLSPHPPTPFPAPGISVTIPVTNNAVPPGTTLVLYRIDPVTGNLVPEPSVSGGFVTGVVSADDLSATFTGLASLSTMVGLIPTGAVIGDVNGDGKVDCADLAIVKAAFGKKSGQPGFDPRADLNNDGRIDINDLAIVLRKLPKGTVCH